MFDLLSKLLIGLNLVSPMKTGRVTDSLLAVKTGPVNFFIYRCGEVYIAIDSGFNARVIKREMAALGIPPEEISHVFLTHSDPDHAGGISVFQNAEIFLSHDEERMITGKTARKFGVFHNARLNRPYTLLKDGQEIIIGPVTVKAVETPGHTPGSMSYLLNSSFLFVGDAFRILKGKARPIGSIVTMDAKKHEQSIRKLAGIQGVEMAITAHRGVTRTFDAAMEKWKTP